MLLTLYEEHHSTLAQVWIDPLKIVTYFCRLFVAETTYLNLFLKSNPNSI